MKRSGQRWSIEGGQTILSLRALAQSEPFDGARIVVLLCQIEFQTSAVVI